MVAIKNILLLAVSAAATVLPRDAATLKSDLSTINSDTVDLTNKVNSYNGGVSNALQIQDAENKLDNDVKSTTTDANNSGVVSATDAQSLIDYINNTLEPNIHKAISALESKKSHFDADGLSGTVLNDLKGLKNDTDTLGSALVSKTPSGKQSNAKAALAKVDDDLQNGINYYS